MKHQISIGLVYAVLSLSSLSKNWPMQKNTKIFFKLKRQLKKKIKNIPANLERGERHAVGQHLCDGIKYTVFI